MTCICAIEHNGVVWMGGDSAGTAGNMHQRIRGDKKVFTKGDFIIGFCGSFRVGQLLQYKLDLPVQPEGKDDFAFLVGEFVDALKSCLKNENDEEAAPNFLFGYKGKLYGVHGDYQISKAEHGFDAVGSGADIAIGALHANRSLKNPRKRLHQALKASALNNAAVRPPFTILSK